MESARLAEQSDVPAIEAVAAAAMQSMDDARGMSVFVRREVATPPGDLARKAIGDPSSIAVVGTYNDSVFGYGIVSTAPLSDGEQLGIIEHLVVDPEIRKSGIGEAMMNLIIDELKSRGCMRVDSYALPGDRNTKNFFESFGLKARLLTVHKEI